MTPADHMTASLRRMEFPELLERVAAHAGSSSGAVRTRLLKPAADRDTALRLRRETEACALLTGKGITPPAGLIDEAAVAIAKLEAGAIVLDPHELRDIGMLVREWVSFASSVRVAAEEDCPIDAIEDILERLPGCGDLAGRLLRITTPDGELSPKASPELARLSAAVERKRRRLSSRLSGLADRLGTKGHLRDAPPTLRNGRFVLPVLSSHKKHVQGIVHDRSESGGTIFIEPMELIGEGNALQEALLDRDQEVRRILREATGEVRESFDDITMGIDALTELDAVFARAAWHLDCCTVFPDEGRMNLPSLSHPLIPTEEVVASDVDLPEDWLVLLVSGPNAGGKSVLLKSIGLAVASSQSGLGALVAGEATIPHFRKIIMSMGDQQSIKDHLSTYSARLEEQLAMVRELAEEGLALIDEPAAGTDPITGAAMAISLLEYLSGCGVRMVISTHMGQLKNLASSRGRFYNGCMSFDEHTLEPDYRFVFGIPGSSFTLDIARRMGYPEDILARAVEMSGDSFRLDALMSELTSLRDTREWELKEVAAERERIEASREEQVTRMSLREEELSRMEHELSETGRKLLHDLESGADSLMTRLSRSDAETRKEVRQEIRDFVESGSDRIPGSPGIMPAGTGGSFSPGDWVSVQGWQGSGLVESIRKDRVVVVLGDIRLERDSSELTPADPPEEKPSDAVWGFHDESPEIHLRGMTLDEAVAELDAKIDNCLMAGISVLRIVHGKGKGILMRGVIDYLRSDRRVRSWRQGEPGEGGTGATIAVLGHGEKDS